MIEKCTIQNHGRLINNHFRLLWDNLIVQPISTR